MNSTSSLTAIMPILVVMVTGMVVLVGDAVLPIWRRSKSVSAVLGLLGIVVALVYSFGLIGAPGPRSAFSGAVMADGFSEACNVILLVSAAIAILLGMTYLENRRINLGEYYVLVLLSTSGAMLMAASNDLIVLFISLEIMSVALYVLAGFARTEPRSEEAALKYFLLGAFAAGFLLYGIALIYGGTAVSVGGALTAPGTTNLTKLAAYVSTLSAQSPPSFMLMSGIALVLVGLGFKAALVPFHMWTPDVYEGAPTSVTAFMAAVAKIGAFAIIFRLFNALLPIQDFWLFAVQALAVITMFVGNILAVTQDNVKRMLAYSSIAHAGYLMVAVSAMAGSAPGAHDAALRAGVFYLLAYSLMTMGAFAVLVWLSHRGRDVQTISDLKGLAKDDPTASYVMLVFMLSLGGIPPTMGFMGKWLIFYAAVLADQTWLAVALALASMISIYYYLRVVWTMCFAEHEGGSIAQRAAAAGGVTTSVVLTVTASLLFGIVPNMVRLLMDAATTIIRP